MKRSATADYQDKKQRAQQRSLSISRDGRDIGPIPPIEDLGRRKRCRESLKLFCETYNPGAFYLPWSEDQLRAIARIEEAATLGALYAFAMPRGAGKSAICRTAAWWAISYGICRYVFVIAANERKAKESLDAVKMWFRFRPEFAADFPEISHPAQSLGGIAHRAYGQISQGETTLIEWSNDRIVLPTVAPPPNWPAEWPLRHDGRVPTSGSLIVASGLTGDGIRGSLTTLSTGELVRPDLVLLDDPQTPESARSPSQNQQREELISADVLGMAGPGKKIAAMMACTVIRSDDCMDRMLDRRKHPLWRGERTKMLRSMPADMAAWDRYAEVYYWCARLEPPDFTRANEHYLEHRVELDAGAEASWEARKHETDVSAIQHAMNLYFRHPATFWAEYQNEPRNLDDGALEELSADQIAGKLNRLPRGEVPQWAVRLTAMVDVQEKLLYYVVCAWGEDFSGAVIDYGTEPDQRRVYFTLRDAGATLKKRAPGAGTEGAVYAGLDRLTARLLGHEWKRADGSLFRVERCLVDANYLSDTVYEFCRQSPHAAVLTPSHGKGVTASSPPFVEYRPRPGDKVGLNWRVVAAQGRRVIRRCFVDVNWWKSFVHARLAVPMGDKGSLSLFGDSADRHRLFAEHLTAEYRVRTEGRNRTVDEWKVKPDHYDNHWLDALVGAAVAASVQGCALPEAGGPAPRAQRERVSFADLQARRRAAR